MTRSRLREQTNSWSVSARRSRRSTPASRVFPPSPHPALGEDAAAILGEAAERLHDNDPYWHPLYAGQMLKPPHPIARAAYALAMSVNPNNHALDGGRASSAMELEAVAALAKMFGWPQHLGHLTSSGTFANLEALWVAGQLHPGRAIAASDQAHYTHTRISGVLGLRFVAIRSDNTGRMDLDALEARASRPRTSAPSSPPSAPRPSAPSIPSTAFSTLQQKYGFRIHVDAAYGGYFTLAGNLEPAARAPPSTPSPTRTRSSSTRTSMACSPTAAAASSSATPPSAASTSTIRPSPTSPRRSSTSARSRSSARAPEPPP